MANDTEDWRSDLTACFEDLKVVERCREEALEHFSQFCEFVAEPAFESLADAVSCFELGGGDASRTGTGSRLPDLRSS